MSNNSHIVQIPLNVVNKEIVDPCIYENATNLQTFLE